MRLLLLLGLVLQWWGSSVAVSSPGPKIKPLLIIVASTRQDVIRMGPVVNLLHGYYSQHMRSFVLNVQVEGGETLLPILNLFGIVPNQTISVAEKEKKSPASLVGGAVESLSAFFAGAGSPVGAVLLQGGSSVALAAALAAFYSRIPVLHMDTGFRSWDLSSPYPEEFNRRTISSVASLSMVATALAKEQLVGRGADPDSVVVTGSPTVSAAALAAGAALSAQDAEVVRLVAAKTRAKEGGLRAKEYVALWPARETGALAEAALAVQALSTFHADHIFIFVLPSGVPKDSAELAVLSRVSNAVVLGHVGYVAALRVLGSARVAVSASDEFLEEASLFGVDYVLLSDTAEWADGVAAGAVHRVSPSRAAIIAAVGGLLSKPSGSSGVGRVSDSAYGDEFSFIRCGCNIASSVLGVSLELMAALGCGESSAISQEFRRAPDPTSPLPRHTVQDGGTEEEQAILAMTVDFPLSKHPSQLFAPRYQSGLITVVLTQYARNTTELQLRAIFAQTCFSRIDRIVVFQNENHLSLDFLRHIDFSSEIIEPRTDFNEAALLRNAQKSDGNMHDIIQVVHSPQRNFKYHGRFALALMFDTEFTAVFDDDTIPQPMWLEYASNISAEKKAIVGPVGVIIGRDKQHYLNAPLQFGLEVDYTGHSWVFKTEWLRYLWGAHIPSWDAGEDIAFSALAWIHGRVRTIMPKMTPDTFELWGDSVKRFHTDGKETYTRRVPVVVRWPLTRYWISQGFVPCMLRDYATKDGSICVGNDPCKAIYINWRNESDIPLGTLPGRIHLSSRRQKLLEEYITRDIVLKVEWMEDIGRPTSLDEEQELKRRSSFAPYRDMTGPSKADFGGHSGGSNPEESPVREAESESGRKRKKMEDIRSGRKKKKSRRRSNFGDGRNHHQIQEDL